MAAEVRIPTRSRVTSRSFLPPWAEALEKRIAAYRAQIEQRRELSKHDPAADTLEWVVADLARLLAEQTDPTKELTVAAYAAARGVRPSTVRRWIHRGELAARPTSRGPMIAASAERQPRALRRDAHAA